MDGLELLHSFGDHRNKKVDGVYTDEQYEKDLQSYVGKVPLATIAPCVRESIFI